MIYQADKAKFHAEDDMIIKWILRTKQTFEPSTTAWMDSQLQSREGAYLDIGAATGWFAIPIALAGRDVIAVEANPRVQERLQENMRLNDVDFTVIKAGASDKAGEVAFNYNPRLKLTSGGSIVKNIGGNSASETIKTVRIDDVVNQPVALIKIDVEGHELPVLNGAENTINTYRPAMVLEANTPEHVKKLSAWLKAHDYTYTIADKRNLLCLPY